MHNEEQHNKAHEIAERLIGRLTNSCHSVYDLLLAVTAGEVALYNISGWAVLSGVAPHDLPAMQQAGLLCGSSHRTALTARMETLPAPTHALRVTPVFDERVRREVSLVPVLVEDEMAEDEGLDEGVILMGFLIYQSALRLAAMDCVGQGPVVELGVYARRFAPEAQITRDLLDLRPAVVCNMPGGEA